MKSIIINITFLLFLNSFVYTNEKPKQDPAIYQKTIKPILDNHCKKCHFPPKRRGGFSYKNKDTFVLGGESGSPIEKLASHKSLMIQLIESEDDDEYMPPKGKRMSKSDIQTLKDWIDGGLTWNEKASIFTNRFSYLNKTSNKPTYFEVLKGKGGLETIKLDKGKSETYLKLEHEGSNAEVKVKINPTFKDTFQRRRLKILIKGSKNKKAYPKFYLSWNKKKSLKVVFFPALGELELHFNDKLLRSTSINENEKHTLWSDDKWYHLLFEVEKKSKKVHLIKAKIWLEGKEEPQKWLILEKLKNKFSKMEAYIGGFSYSKTPLYFKDLICEDLP